MENKISVARTVHYVNDDLLCLAAVIIFIEDDGSPRLFLTTPQGSNMLIKNAKFSEEKEVDTWHWPERV